MQCNGYAAKSAKDALSPFSFERREVGDNDVLIDIKYCGICHSDVHQARDEWGGGIFPMVPGHEIMGVVSKVGKNVKNFKVGDQAGVGCMVESCGHCENCKENYEQFCTVHTTYTYNSLDNNGKPSFGGYSNAIVVDEKFVLKVPKNMDMSKAAPLLCAGITTYSPLKHWKVSKGQKVGVMGLGGLGHMAIKFAHAFGAHVVCFTTSPSKVADAKRLGADEVVISNNKDEMKKHINSFDFLLNTISAKIDLTEYLQLLKRDGTMVLVGVPEHAPELPANALIFGRKSLAGSLIGGIKETQEMLDFCGANNITCDVEIISMQKVNEAFDRMVKNDVKYRFVIDMKTLQG